MTAVESVPPAGERSADRWSRWSDHLNPILVREVQQAIKGRVFPLTILIALAISVVIAAVVSEEYSFGGTGRNAFRAGFATLIPLVLFVVPMQAYNSMRTELKGGIVEQLLLTRLSPSRVLSGKLQAAMVQFVLYVSILSPLLATSYLLRGVDVVTIGLSLLMALILCVTATALAVSSAAQGVVPALQPIANLGTAFGLGIGTFGMISAVVSGGFEAMLGALVRSGSFSAVVSAVLLLALLSTALSWLAARSFLLHAFENRSSAFRVLLFVLPVLAYGWLLAFVEPRHRDGAFPILTFGLLLVSIVFGVFMVTEQGRMSPRVDAHVPKAGWRALLLAPLLPGRDRGALCLLLFHVLLVAIAVAFWPLASVRRWHPAAVLPRVGAMTMAYVWVYLGLLRWLRARLPENVRGSQAARVLLPAMLFLFCVAPLLVDAIVRGGPDEWHLGHVMNPFWTIAEFAGQDKTELFPTVYAVIGLALLPQLPAFVRGLREVSAASRRNRSRAGPKPTSASDDA
ncbi:MAG TPA: hypothetical protein ENI87_06175 [bacterium]|nr:hypothetical protein [bacterium]